MSFSSPSTGNTFDAYKAKALTASKPSSSPPDGLPVGGLRKTSVIVGVNGLLQYSPNNITSLVGEVVEFNFNPAVGIFSNPENICANISRITRSSKATLGILAIPYQQEDFPAALFLLQSLLQEPLSKLL
jgi:hypothetical protein